MKNCDDEQSADMFVQSCQRLCDQVYEEGQELDLAQEAELGNMVKRAMLYKVGKLDHSMCKCCCVERFARRGL